MFSDSDPEGWSSWFANRVQSARERVDSLFTEVDRNLVRHFPTVNDSVNYHFGYNAALLKPHSIAYLKYLLKRRRVNLDDDRGFNPLSFAATVRVDQKERIYLLLQHRVPVNSLAIAHAHRTPLQLLIQDENQLIAVFFIETAKKMRIVINFGLSDENGCTAVLFAAKKRQEKTALCIIDHIAQQEGILNACDNEGGTALYYAFILGQANLFERLLALSPNSEIIRLSLMPVDHFNKTVISAILSSVEMDPERDEKATCNYIHDAQRQALMFMSVRPGESVPHATTWSLASKKSDRLAKDIEKIMKPEAFLVDSKYRLNGSSEIRPMSADDKRFIQQQYEGFSGKSLVQCCMDRQQVCREMLTKHLESASIERVGKKKVKSQPITSSANAPSTMLIADPQSVTPAFEPAACLFAFERLTAEPTAYPIDSLGAPVALQAIVFVNNDKYSAPHV